MPQDTHISVSWGGAGAGAGVCKGAGRPVRPFRGRCARRACGWGGVRGGPSARPLPPTHTPHTHALNTQARSKHLPPPPPLRHLAQEGLQRLRVPRRQRHLGLVQQRHARPAGDSRGLGEAHLGGRGGGRGVRFGGRARAVVWGAGRGRVLKGAARPRERAWLRGGGWRRAYVTKGHHYARRRPSARALGGRGWAAGGGGLREVPA